MLTKVFLKKKEWVAGLIIFLVPFIYLFRYLIPNQFYSRIIVNDFGILYYAYKVYLLDALSHFRIPLWSPSEACGFPFYSNPFTQTFYPLNLALTIFYKVFDGYSYFDHQAFTVLGIGIFAVGTYCWLRSLNIAMRFAIWASMIVSTSFKITEIVRFPNAVHTIAWLPFILWGCTLTAHKATHIKGALMIFLSMVMLLTGGYLYYVYYSFFIIAPYILLLMFPQTRQAFMAHSFPNIKMYLMTLGVSFLSAFAVCFPYLLKVFQLLSQTLDRGGKSFEFSTAHEFMLSDTLGSLLFPPASQIEGWYYFGIINVLIIVVYYLLVILKADETRRDATFLWVISVWFVLITYITHGKYSYLFKFLWHYFPGFSHLRVWGRMNIILLPLIAVLLARAYAGFEWLISQQAKRAFYLFFMLFSGVYLMIFLTQYYFYANQLFDSYWRTNFLRRLAGAFDEKHFLYMGCCAYLLIGIILAGSHHFRCFHTRVIQNIIIMVVIVMSVYDVGAVATKQWSSHRYVPITRRKLDLDTMNFQALSKKRAYQYNTISLNSDFKVGFIFNWYFERYINFLKIHGSPIENFDANSKSNELRQLLGINDGTRLYFSKSIDYAVIKDFLSDAILHSEASHFEMVVMKYTGDELHINVQTTAQGYLSFIDNWDNAWTALVNGQPMNIERLFGTFKSVKIEKGMNVIEFIYQPKFL